MTSSGQSTAIREFALPALLHAARSGDRPLLDEFDAVCTDLGAFVLTDPPVTEAALDDVYGQTLAFFQLPREQLEVLRDPGGDPYLGWDGADDPGTDSAKRKQMFHIGPRISPSLTTPDAFGTYGPPSDDPGLGLWPAGLPAFTAAWHAYYRQMQDTAAQLGEVMAATLGLELDRWRQLTAHNWGDLAANYYPAARDGDVGSRNAVHADQTMFTVLYQDDGGGGGLRMQRRSGQWTDVPPIPGTYLVNIGELLAFLTGGRWWAVPHEVTAPDVTDPAARTTRVSIPFFFRPNGSAILTPFDDVTADAVLMSEWLAGRRAAATT